jgi:2-succinyl-5-enolpyruvyl-6-hydroxy-3-cyclohexene-1-carboxylate synthase
MNPSGAFAATVVDELVRCGLREAVLAPGSRSAPLALALYDRAGPAPRGVPGGRPPGPALRLHVRIDERSAAFLALGLAKASRRPVLVVCTSGSAAAHFHAAVIEADESGVPLIVLTADRPPELRGTGANQAIDQLRLYGGAVRWFCEAGVPEARPGQAGYWRSLACRAWAQASGEAGGLPGPVHVNAPLREPLVPAPGDDPGGRDGWPDSLGGRPGGAPWTSFGAARRPGGLAGLEIGWTERGVIVCGDGAGGLATGDGSTGDGSTGDGAAGDGAAGDGAAGDPEIPGALLELAEAAGWPVLAEPSSGARRGPNALSAYPYLLDTPGFVAAHQPDLIVSAGRPGLSRGQLALLRGGGPGGWPARHIVVASGPGRWADPGRGATDVTCGVRLSPAGRARRRGESGWLSSWRRADAAARGAVDAVLDETGPLTEPRLARDLATALPDGALLWAASSLPIRDLDQQMAPRAGLRVLASRGASGIDGLVSSAIGAALAHQAAGGGPAVALLGDLALLHDAPGLVLGPGEPRPDLCVIVVNNDGGGIFSMLEQAAIPGPFERLFGTPHGADIGQLARAVGLPCARLGQLADLPGLLAGGGLRVIEARTDRAAGAALRARLRQLASAAVSAAGPR